MWKKFIIICSLLVSLVGCKQKVVLEKDTLYMHFFQAGKADATLIYSDECTILIDTGEEELYSTIVDYMKKIGKDQIDVMILTHFDKDHIGCAASLIQKYSITTIIQSNEPKDSEYYMNYLSAMHKKGYEAITVENKDYSFSIDGMEIVVNGPKGNYSKKESNNSSLITSITYYNTSYLFTGDAMDERIEEYLENHKDSYDLLKVPYHGHELDLLPSLVEVVQPAYSIITSSQEELEDSSTIHALSNSTIYLTRNGAVDVKSDGQIIEIQQ